MIGGRTSFGKQLLYSENNDLFQPRLAVAATRHSNGRSRAPQAIAGGDPVSIGWSIEWHSPVDLAATCLAAHRTSCNDYRATGCCTGPATAAE